MELTTINYGIPMGWNVFTFTPWRKDTYIEKDFCGEWTAPRVDICFSVVNWGGTAATRIDKKFWYKESWYPKWPGRSWWKEVNKYFFPVKIEKNYGHEWAVVEKSSLIKFTLLDIPARYPGMYYAYLKLRKMLPHQNPWYLLQVVHMLPVCTYMVDDAQCTSDVVGYALKMEGGNSSHALGYMCGVQPITKETFKERLERSHRCEQLFGSMWIDDNKYIPLEWTWEQFAKWADQYITEQTQ